VPFGSLQIGVRIRTVLGRVFHLLMGFERIKRRGDRRFLDGNFVSALREYQRARGILSDHDYRVPTLEALIRECFVRTGSPVASRPMEIPRPSDGSEREPHDERSFVPDMSDLLELAVGSKSPERAALYRGWGTEFEQGYVALVQGDAERASALLAMASRRAPTAFVVHLELGRSLSLAGDMNAARVELEKAVRISPSDLEALCLLAAVHLALGEYSKAEAILIPRVDREGAGAELSFLLGRSLAARGKRREALERFRQAVERDAGFADAYWEAGKLVKEEGDDRRALFLLSRASAIVPDEIDYNRELAMLVVERGLDVSAGLAACDRLMMLDEDNRWQYLGWIAELYLRRGWKREALDPLRKAVALVPAERLGESLDLRKRLVELESGM
jgi:tetratricopeptide (TPR) repeat protein